MPDSIDVRSCPTTRDLSSRPVHSEDDPDNLVGHSLAGQYTLMERIGEGAYGRVYRAEQVALHRDIAVKVLDPDLTSVAEFVERFRREAFASWSSVCAAASW